MASDMKKYIYIILSSLLILCIPESVLGQAQLVRDINKGSESSGPVTFSDVGPEIYFNARADNNARVFWKSDGTLKGTIKVKDVSKGDGVVLDGIFYFGGFEECPTCRWSELFRSDGTAEGTYHVQGPPPAVFDPSRPYVHSLTKMGGRL